jgi:hypothetical protein
MVGKETRELLEEANGHNIAAHVHLYCFRCRLNFIRNPNIETYSFLKEGLLSKKWT